LTLPPIVIERRPEREPEPDPERRPKREPDPDDERFFFFEVFVDESDSQ
jgi:hypothetical protein